METKVGNEVPLQLWHGGRLEGPAEPRPSRSGHYESGPGIYLTTQYERARRYSRGGKSTYIVTLSTPIRWLEDVKVSADVMVQWVHETPGLRHKREITNDLLAAGTKLGSVPLLYLVNHVVNYQALQGRHGVELARWLVSQGVDASLDHHSTNEDWVIVYNPSIIKNTKLVKAKDVDWTNDPDFPLIKEQLMTTIKYQGTQYRIVSSVTSKFFDILDIIDRQLRELNSSWAVERDVGSMVRWQLNPPNYDTNKLEILAIKHKLFPILRDQGFKFKNYQGVLKVTDLDTISVDVISKFHHDRPRVLSVELRSREL